MTNRKSKATKRSIHTSPGWEEDDEIQLLAWLDCCLKHKIDFKDTIVDHLRRSQGKTYTYDNVKNKLRSLWERLGNDDSKKCADIYYKGTECLDKLNEYEKKEISKTAKELSNNLPEKQPISKVVVLVEDRFTSHSRTTRSRSQTCHSHGSFDEQPQRVYSTTGKRKASRHALERNNPHQLNRTDEKENQMIRQQFISSDIPPNNQRRPRQDPEETFDSEEIETSIGKRVTGLATKSNSSLRGTQQLTLAHALDAQRTGRNDLSSLLADISNPVLQKRLLVADARIQKLFQTIIALGEDVREHMDCLISALRQNKMNIEVYDKEYQIGLLQRKLKESREVGRFTSDIERASLTIPSDQVTKRMDNICTDINDIIYLSDLLQPSFSNANIKVQDTERLIYRSLGLTSKESPSLTLILKMFCKIPPPFVLRALIATAVSLWVFETDFPKFDEESSLLLRKYRELLLLQDGPSALRNLDLAAHHCLINEEYFVEEIIPQKARDLAILLSQVLRPFFHPGNTGSSPNGFDTWGQIGELSIQRRDRFTSLFEEAIKLKTELMLQNGKYEIFTPAPGMKYDERSMRIDEESSLGFKGEANNSNSIMLCLYPAIYYFEKEDIVTPLDIRSCNFIKTSDLERQDAKLINKAVIILEDVTST